MSSMENKYTPGPWRIGEAGCTVFGPKTDAPAPKTVASITRNPMPSNEQRANAALIAAAPDMYEAMEAAERQFDAWDELEPVEDLGYAMLFIEDVRAALGYFRALAKAEGRA
jgi:hypothetical protein